MAYACPVQPKSIAMAIVVDFESRLFSYEVILSLNYAWQ
jgi:hypothetical protein